MTFYEAAVQVLRAAGRPLHFKKITELSVEGGLLSHIGRTPEQTMHRRLTQESKKPDGESLVLGVRPGVFALRDGASDAEAKETINLRPKPAPTPDEAPEADDEEDEEVEAADDADDVDDAGQDDDAADAKSGDGDNNKKKRRRRGRRGGRNRNPQSEESDDKRTDDSKRPQRADQPRADRPRADQPRAELPSKPSIGDIAAAIAEVLDASPRARALSASKIASGLAERRVGALDTLGTAALRDVMLSANASRADAGRPPLFDETKPNFWTLATASGKALAQSYSALDEWQDTHRSALHDAIVHKLRELDGKAIGSLVTILLDRLGYSGLERHGDDAELTLSATAPRGLTTVRIAVRIAKPSRPVTGDDVATLRGALHRYEAAEGLLVAVGGIDAGAAEEAIVPNTAPVALLSVEALADRMVEAGVGTGRFRVDVSCLDEALFRELKRG